MTDERFGPTRRGGPVFRWLGERPAIDLANTVMVVREGEEVDLLATERDLTRWLQAERNRLPGVRPTQRTLEKLRGLRNAVRTLLVAVASGRDPSRSTLKRISAAAEAAPMSRRLEARGTGALVARIIPLTNDPLRQLVGALATDAIDLVTGTERERLQICQAPSCGMLFVGARRWCCRACGNRARVARHYRRTKSSVSS
jgi:predicted RNA-binding Zn ribbon-like protein